MWHRAASEPGIALLVVVMALSLLLALGLALTSVTIGETALAAAYGQSAAVFYAAEAAGAYAVQSLARQPDWSGAIEGRVTASFRDDSAFEPTTLDTPPGQLYAYGWLHDLMPPGTPGPRLAVAAWVATDPETAALVITARAAGSNGSRRTIELQIVQGVPPERPRIVSWREVR